MDSHSSDEGVIYRMLQVKISIYLHFGTSKDCHNYSFILFPFVSSEQHLNPSYADNACDRKRKPCVKI